MIIHNDIRIYYWPNKYMYGSCGLDALIVKGGEIAWNLQTVFAGRSAYRLTLLIRKFLYPRGFKK